MRRSLLLLMIVSVSACVSPAPENTGAPPAPVRTDRGTADTGRDTPPASVLPQLRIDPERALGSAAASIAIVEFGDYQCPYCRGFHAGTFSRLRSAYIDTGKARYFYKEFPLRMHQHAFGASVAAYCAGAQKRYWQMQDSLYGKQAQLSEALYIELAEELKLDVTQFNTCRRSRAAHAAIGRDLEDGRRLGISGTPSFVLGRVDGDRVIVQRMATGAPAFEVFARELDALAR